MSSFSIAIVNVAARSTVAFDAIGPRGLSDCRSPRPKSVMSRSAFRSFSTKASRSVWPGQSTLPLVMRAARMGLSVWSSGGSSRSAWMRSWNDHVAGSRMGCVARGSGA